MKRNQMKIKKSRSVFLEKWLRTAVFWFKRLQKKIIEKSFHFCLILMKFGVEVNLWQIWRKMKWNPDSECFNTPLPSPAYHPNHLKTLTLAFFVRFWWNLVYKSIWGRFEERWSKILIWGVLSPLHHPWLTTPTTPKC